MSDSPLPGTESSLIERLRNITGVTEPVPPAPPEPEPPYDAPPPVDKLMAGLRESVALAAACGIAAAVLLVALSISAWQTAKPAALAAAKKVRAFSAAAAARLKQKLDARREKRRAAPALPEIALQAPVLENPLPVQEPEPAMAAPEPVIETASVIAEPAAPVVAPVETAKPVEVSAPPDTAGAPPPSKRLAFLSPRTAAFAALAVLLIAGALAAIPASRYYFTDWLCRGNERIVAGSDGWIFLRSELQPAPADATALRQTAAALRARCDNLVVLRVPARAAVYPEKTGAEEPPAFSVEAALKELTAAGAGVMDLAPVLVSQKGGDAKDGPVFNAQDTYWSPRGMIAAAAAAAGHIQQQPAFAALPMNPSLAVMEPVTAPAANGVLVNEWQTARSRGRYAPAPQPLIRIVTPDKKEPLPDEPASGLVILGGPALAIYDATGPALPDKAVPAAGFGRHLAYLLNTPVHSSPGDNARRAAETWLKNPGEKRRIIVWLLEDGDFQP